MVSFTSRLAPILWIAAALSFATLPALATAEEAAGPACDDSALEARVAALEAMVARLEARLGSEPERVAAAEASALGDGEIEAVATAEASRPAAAPAHEEATANSRTRAEPTTDSRLAYLPSRGWQAAWSTPSGIQPGVRAFIDSELIDEGPDGARGGSSTFDNHHVQVFLDAKISPKFSAHAELEWEHSGDVIEVDKAIASWHVKGDSLRLDFGRFYTPFGIERWVWYSPTNSLVSRPEAFRRIVPNNFYANGVQASGVVNHGDRGIFSWEAAVSDGLSREVLSNRRGSRQTRDDNDNKAVSGRIGYAWWPWVEIGASAHTQRYTEDGAMFEGSRVDDDLLFVGVDFAARWQGYEVRAEWVEASFERQALGLGDLDQDGGYLQGSYTWEWDRDFLPSLTTVVRLDQWTLDADVQDGTRDALSIALNAALHHRFRLKAERQWRNEEGLALDDDRWLFQAVVDF